MKAAFLISIVFMSLGCSTVVRTTLPFNDLPAPSGPFGVGTQIETWADASRPEAFTAKATDIRRIVIQVWYPTIAKNEISQPYVTQPDKRMRPFAKSMGLPRFLVDHIREVQTHSALNAPLHPEIEKFPLLIFSHGLGGMKSQNMIQAEEFASLGYVVVSADHAYDAYLTIFEDGTTADYRSGSDGITNEEEFWAARTPQLATRAADVSFMLDVIKQATSSAKNDKIAIDTNPLWQRVDLTKVGLFGHSFGGATTIVTTDQDPRIRAGVALDGWMVPVPEQLINKGMQKPLLYLGQEHWDEPLNYEKLAAFEANSAGRVRSEILVGTKHMDFADAPHLSSFARRVGFAGSMPSEELRKTLNQRLLSFFSEHVGKPAGVLETSTTAASK